MYMGRTPTLDLTGLLLLPLRNYFSTLPVTKKQTEKRNLPVVGDALLISASSFPFLVIMSRTSTRWLHALTGTMHPCAQRMTLSLMDPRCPLRANAMHICV